jgi:hypothetical protein
MTPTMYPYLSYRDAASALRFLEEAFGFATTVRWDAPDGTVQHAEATFGDRPHRSTAFSIRCRVWRIRLKCLRETLN